LANTSCNRIATELLGQCLRGEPWQPALLDRLLRDGCDEALFRIVAEGLADRFEPRLCRAYDEIFARALQVPIPRRGPARLRDFRRVFVLSRVTLGADVAVTSVILDAVKRRFPRAEVHFAGPRKSWELFACDPRIRHAPVTYYRGSIADRLAHWPELRQAVDHEDALVIDPDSRLTQLGLLPVCPEENYLFFESRSYGGDGDESLAQLTARWCREMLQADGRPYIAVDPGPPLPQRSISISLGTGENPNKRVADPFEPGLLQALARTGAHLWVDAGAGGEEAERVMNAAAGIPESRLHLCRGSFAAFAAIIQSSHLYIGYDSAGQHVAAACGIPQITIFTGEPCERMFHRWRPFGHGEIHVIRPLAQPAPLIKTILDSISSLSAGIE
jgi:ADP-heptose:LPS heptosyltransferase